MKKCAYCSTISKTMTGFKYSHSWYPWYVSVTLLHKNTTQIPNSTRTAFPNFVVVNVPHTILYSSVVNRTKQVRSIDDKCYIDKYC